MFRPPEGCNKYHNMETNKFLEVIDLTPLVSIDLILQRSDHKYLLGKRSNKPAQGYWFVPGGRIRKNETLDAAMRRISKTELGFEINITEALLLGAYDHIYDDNFTAASDINTHYVALGYKVKVASDICVHLDAQHTSLQWLSEDELLSAELVHNNTKKYFEG